MNDTEIEKYASMVNDFDCKETDNNEDNANHTKTVICKDCNIPTITHGLDIWECYKHVINYYFV